MLTIPFQSNSEKKLIDVNSMRIKQQRLAVLFSEAGPLMDLQCFIPNVTGLFHNFHEGCQIECSGGVELGIFVIACCHTIWQFKYSITYIVLQAEASARRLRTTRLAAGSFPTTKLARGPTPRRRASGSTDIYWCSTTPNYKMKSS